MKDACDAFIMHMHFELLIETRHKYKCLQCCMYFFYSALNVCLHFSSALKMLHASSLLFLEISGKRTC